MNPNRVGGAGALRANLVREPIGLEATITEETWTENALAIVSKVRTSQADVDMMASIAFGVKTGTLNFAPNAGQWTC